MGPYILVFAGVIFTSVAFGKALATLDRAYRRLTDGPQRPLHHAHLRASGQEKLERPKTGPVGTVMAVSVIVALSALVVWVVATGHPFVPVPL